MKTPYSIIVICFICLIVSCKKDNPPISEEDKLTEHISGVHFDYYYSKSDKDILDTAWQEKYYTWLTGQIQVTVTAKLQYFKYRDNAHIKRVTGRSGNGFAEPGTYKFHTIGKADNHECVHSIVILLIGHPPALFNEGIAVAHSANYLSYPKFIPGWNNQDFNTLSKIFKQNGETPPLDKLLGTSTFWDYKAEITYPVSGSFVRYVIDRYGITKMKELIKISKFEDSKDKIRSDFSHIYGLTIEKVWNDWEIFIASYNE